MYCRSTFWRLDFGDSNLCQRGNQRGINFPIQWNLKRVFVDCVGLKLLQVLVKGIGAKRIDRDVVLGDRHSNYVLLTEAEHGLIPGHN